MEVTGQSCTCTTPERGGPVRQKVYVGVDESRYEVFVRDCLSTVLVDDKSCFCLSE